MKHLFYLLIITNLISCSITDLEDFRVIQDDRITNKSYVEISDINGNTNDFSTGEIYEFHVDKLFIWRFDGEQTCSDGYEYSISNGSILVSRCNSTIDEYFVNRTYYFQDELLYMGIGSRIKIYEKVE